MKRMLCFLLCVLLLTAALSGCGKSKVAKVLVSKELADTALVAQLSDAFTAQTGYTVELVKKDRKEIEKALEKDDFDAALVIAQNTEKLQSGEWIGGNVFFDTLYLVGPKNDPASAAHLSKYAISDVLKHLTLTGYTFVHPALITPLGMRDVSLWLMADATPETDQFILAQDAGQRLIQAAKGCF